MDPNLAANPYFQAGLVGAFMTFSLALVGLFIRHLNARDSEYRKERNEQSVSWRAFFDMERSKRAEDSASVTSSLRELTASMNMMTQEQKNLAILLIKHDESMRVASAKIAAAEVIRLVQAGEQVQPG
jgi:hypothetical protein